MITAALHSPTDATMSLRDDDEYYDEVSKTDRNKTSSSGYSIGFGFSLHNIFGGSSYNDGMATPSLASLPHSAAAKPSLDAHEDIHGVSHDGWQSNAQSNEAERVPTVDAHTKQASTPSERGGLSFAFPNAFRRNMSSLSNRHESIRPPTPAAQPPVGAPLHPPASLPLPTPHLSHSSPSPPPGGPRNGPDGGVLSADDDRAASTKSPNTLTCGESCRKKIHVMSKLIEDSKDEVNQLNASLDAERHRAEDALRRIDTINRTLQSERTKHQEEIAAHTLKMEKELHERMNEMKNEKNEKMSDTSDSASLDSDDLAAEYAKQIESARKEEFERGRTAGRTESIQESISEKAMQARRLQATEMRLAEVQQSAQDLDKQKTMAENALRDAKRKLKGFSPDVSSNRQLAIGGASVLIHGHPLSYRLHMRPTEKSIEASADSSFGRAFGRGYGQGFGQAFRPTSIANVGSHHTSTDIELADASIDTDSIHGIRAMIKSGNSRAQKIYQSDMEALNRDLHGRVLDGIAARTTAVDEISRLRQSLTS